MNIKHESSNPMTMPVTIPADVLQEIVATVGRKPPESGGLLGGNRDRQEISRYLFDGTASTTGAAYSPDTAVVNATLQAWEAESGDRIIGFIHSHPVGYDRPSGGDQEYAARILKAIPAMQRLFLPIAVFRNTGGNGACEFEIRPYVAYLDEKQDVVISPVEMRIPAKNGEQSERVASWKVSVPSPFEAPKQPAKDETFTRVVTAYDLDLLHGARLVVAGVGGAAQLVEALARTGVGQFVLIDHDVVSTTNLATQQTYRRDIGRPKVLALAERILDINPAALVIPVRKRLEELDDREMGKLIQGPVRGSREKPEKALLCGFTDSFPAQIRINRLALQFGIPSLCAQMYREARGGEVTFTHPLVTPACHRCALSSRYRAHEENRVEAVTSDGSSIFSTMRLNAVSGYVAMALLHHGSGHPRWGGLLKGVADRNLVLVRMDPGFRQATGLDVFERTFGDSNRRVYFDETIWTPVTPDDGQDGSPICPDCGGLGLLEVLGGTYADTRTGARKSTMMCDITASASDEDLDRHAEVLGFRRRATQGLVGKKCVRFACIEPPLFI